jgi:hypothetical protein
MFRLHCTLVSLSVKRKQWNNGKRKSSLYILSTLCNAGSKQLTETESQLMYSWDDTLLVASALVTILISSLLTYLLIMNHVNNETTLKQLFI